MKLCSRLFVLYCGSCPKDDKFRYIDPHFEEVSGGVEPWLMARWKARVDFLLTVIEFLFLSLTVDALQGKTCQNSLLFGNGWVSLSQDFRGKGSSVGNIFWFLQNWHILLSDSANCTVLRAVVLTQYRRVTDGRMDRQTDGRTNGIAIASTALAMRALRRAVKKTERSDIERVNITRDNSAAFVTAQFILLV